jgi:hypothetical protein
LRRCCGRSSSGNPNRSLDGEKTLIIGRFLEINAPVTEKIAIKNRKEQPAAQNAADGGDPS